MQPGQRGQPVQPAVAPAGPVTALVRIQVLASHHDAEPLALRYGQRLLAEVLAADGATGRAVLSLAGRRLEAQLPPETLGSLRPGSVIALSIVEAGPERLVFRLDPGPVSTPPSPPATTTTGAVAPALDAALVLSELDLPATPPFRAAVGALVAAAQPLEREAIVAVRNAIVAAGGDLDGSARAAALLRSLDVPLTARSLALARAAGGVAAGAAGAPGGPLGHAIRELLRSVIGAGGEAVAEPAGGSPGTDVRTLGARAADAGELRRVVHLMGDPVEAPLAVAARRAGGAPPESAAASDVSGRSGETSGVARAPGRAASTTGTQAAATAPPQNTATPGTGSTGDARVALGDAPAAGRPPAVGGEGSASPAPATTGTPPPPSARTILAQLAQALIEAPANPAAAASRDVPGGARVPAPAQPAAPPGGSATATSAVAPVALPAVPGSASVAAGAVPTEEASSLAAARPPLDTAPVAGTQAALAGHVHDLVELEQLRNAVIAARERARAGGGVPPLNRLPGDVAARGTTGSVVHGAEPAPSPGGTPSPASAPPSGSASPGPALLPGPDLPPYVVTVPLAFGGRLETLELAVQRDAPRRTTAGDAVPGVRAQLTLTLDRLGSVGADLRLHGAAVRCILRATEGPPLTALAAAVPSLRARLAAAGFQVDTVECWPAGESSGAPPNSEPALHRVDLGA